MKDEINLMILKIDLKNCHYFRSRKVEKKKKKADKLLKLKVDTGVDVRTVVSGIAESFSPEEIIGKTSNDFVESGSKKNPWN